MLPDSKFSWLLKSALAVLLLWFIADRLFLSNNFEAQLQLFRIHFSLQNLIWIIVAILLMPVNWWLETKKWNLLLSNNISMHSAWKSVMAGVTLGFVSPARIGEFAGRIWHLPTEMRTRAFYLSNIGGLAQTAVTLAAGSICFSLWVQNPFLSGMLVGVSAIFLLLYFRFDWITALLEKIALLRDNNFTIANNELPGLNLQIQVAGISLLRYCVYVAQYAFAFRFFGIEADWFTLAIHSGVLLLINSFSPLLPALDFSFRCSVVLLVFAAISSNNIALVCATTFIWLLNLVLPALIGYFFIIRKEKHA